MACSLVAGSALGAPFGELLELVVTVSKQTAKFKSILNRLKSTLTAIHPIIIEVSELDKVLDHHSQDETLSFLNQLKIGKELIRKCSLIQRWHVYKKYDYSNKLLQLDSAILDFFQVTARAQLCSISRKGLVGVRNLESRTDRILSAVTHRRGISGLCSVPELPDFVIAFDLQVEELKEMLLKDDVSVVVISAPAGCGKSTLAKKLCHDYHIRDRFGDNIFYVTVSQQDNLRVIAKKLFEHCCPKQLREFPTDEEAKNQLENLMKELESDHKLLVLDDVLSESESLIHNLKFQIPGFKILVTSRFVFPSFGSTYRLKMLNDDDAKTLFLYSAFTKDKVPNVPDDLVNEIVKGCKGSPLALTVIGASLRGQPVLRWRSTVKKWSQCQSTLDSYRNLQTSIDHIERVVCSAR